MARVTVIKDDLTGREIDEQSVITVEWVFGDQEGTFEGSEGSIAAVLQLLRDHNLQGVIAMHNGGCPQAPKAMQPKKPRVSRANGDHSSSDTRQWCATLPGIAAVKRLGITVPAKGKMPKALIEEWREWQASNTQ